jgi:thiol-disulfide isomerase/thioredoxin
MNKDNLSALAMAIAVVSLIVGFAVYFNSPELNKVVSGKEATTTSNFVPAIQVVQEGSNDTTTTTTTNIKEVQFPIDKLQFKKAPEFDKITGYINTEPINLSNLKGKVVLVDFWTYSCANCIRTIPYLVE